MTEIIGAYGAIVAANSVLIAIDQACRLLHRQMESIADAFRTVQSIVS